MKVDVRLYLETGYDFINRPDSSATIEHLANHYYDLPDIYVTQNKGLTEIVVPLRYYTIKGVDYLRLTSKSPCDTDSFVSDDRRFFPDYEGPDTDHAFETVYYIVTAQPEMINENCARIPIQMDYITTFGISQSDFITGQINAAHVPVNDWKYVRIPETRFQPTGVLESMMYDVKNTDIKPDDNTGVLTILNTTADIVSTACCKQANISVGTGDIFDGVGPYAPGTLSKIGVAVPLVIGNQHKTTFEFVKITGANDDDTITYDVVKYIPASYASYAFKKYDESITIAGVTSTGETQRNGISLLRSLGLDDVIQASYDVDACYTVTPVAVDDVINLVRNNQIDSSTTLEVSETKLYNVKPMITRLNNAIPSTFSFEYVVADYTVRNKKVYCGENNKYIIVSKCTGNKMEINPEDIIHFGNNQPLMDKPTFIITSDLRANGCPKIFPLWYHNKANLLMVGINGMTWANHQIIYDRQSGYELVNNQFKFESAQRMRTMNTSGIGNVFSLGSQSAQLGAFANLGSNKMSTADLVAGGYLNKYGQDIPVANMVTGQFTNVKNATYAPTGAGVARHLGTAGIAAGILSSIGSTFYNAWEGPIQSYFEQNQAAIANYLATGNTIAPEIDFPFAESNREMYGNYFTILKLKYSDSMIKQMDAFYDLWGYMVGGIEITGETDNWLNNREYFNYISMTNVTLNRKDMNVWERQGLATELANVRLWHDNVLPADWRPNMYNNIRGNT